MTSTRTTGRPDARIDHQALRAVARRAGVALDLETMTVHGAKGLEADYVIFVQGRDRKVKDELREQALERALQPLLPAGGRTRRLAAEPTEGALHERS